VTSGRRVALAQFGISSFAVVLVLATIGAVGLSRVATREALDGARSVTAALARGTIGPAISAAALRGDPAALAKLDRKIRARVLFEPIVRVKVWTPDGRIAYSDKPALIGERYPLPPDLRKALRGGGAHAEVSVLTRPENRFERAEGKLVEVYMPFTTGSGDRVVIETYRRAGSIDAVSRRLVGAFLPILLTLLVGLGIAQLPLGTFLVRRVRQQEREREQVNRRTSAAVEAERLRIAADLHDGVVQDLAGTAYELQAVGDRLPVDPCAEACRDSVRALRVLLVDLHPNDGRPPELAAALDELARPVRTRGLRVNVSVTLGEPPPPDVVELVYRGAQEALRNVDRHADARTAQVTVYEGDGGVVLDVEDDGRGMTEADLEEHITDGHMGLRLLADCVAARGGSLQIESEPCAGTRLSLRVPTIRPGDPAGRGSTAAALVSVGSTHTERSHHGL
jgi:signal transduction histidine kinase